MDDEHIAQLKKDLRDQGYSLYVYSYPAGMVFPPTSHDYAKIHIVLSGMLQITIGEQAHVLHAGDRLLVPAKVSHRAEVMGEMAAVCVDATKYEE